MKSSATPRASVSAKALTMAAHASFVPIGIVTVLLGPMLPQLSVRWSLSEAQAGFLFTAQFIGASFGVAASGLVVSKWGYRVAIGAGLVAMALGVASLLHSSREVGAAWVACYGLGSGIAVPAANLLVAELNPTRRSAALSRLNFSWSLGAVICPFLVAAAAGGIRIMLGAISAFLLVVAMCIAMIPSSNVASDPLKKDDEAMSRRRPLQPRHLAVLGALFFLYVGTEVAFGGWVASYAKGLGSMPTAWSVMSPSFFYGALMVGRWIAPLVLRRVEDVRLARAGIALAGAGIVGMIGSRGASGVVISSLVAGLGLAAVYPITIALLSRDCGTMAARVGAIMFTFSNLGGACLPWLVGAFAQHFGNLKAGLAVPVATAGMMYVLYATSFDPVTEV
jgi:MFS transporter, FHS family, glucose/mannose:H+ symporter